MWVLEATYSSESLVKVNQTSRKNNPEGYNLQLICSLQSTYIFMRSAHLPDVISFPVLTAAETGMIASLTVSFNFVSNIQYSQQSKMFHFKFSTHCLDIVDLLSDP
jgi:hypothetical protein